MNASIQIKTHSVSSARNKNTHILRNSEAYENPRIIILLQNDNTRFSKPTKAKPERAVLQNEENRKNELKKVNSAIAVYTKRIEAILPDDDDEEKRKRLQKLEEKKRELLKKREELKEAKEVAETRGKKQKHHYIEFVFSITNSNAYLEDDEFVELFQELQTEFLKNNNVFKGLEMETNAIHLDQYSVHSHALFKLPEGITWKKYLAQFDVVDGREAYRQLAKVWHSYVKTSLFKNFGITLENQESGKRYISLKSFKKQNPIPNIEKSEKINSSEDMSGLDGNIVSAYRSALRNHELLLSKSKESTQSENSNNQRVTEAQPSPQSTKPQNRAKR